MLTGFFPYVTATPGGQKDTWKVSLSEHSLAPNHACDYINVGFVYILNVIYFNDLHAFCSSKNCQYS